MKISRLLIVLVSAFSLPASAQQLGKLFFTPEQRATLEQLKQTPATPSAPAVTSDTITVNGMVQRSDGSNILWINNAQQSVTSGAKGLDPKAVPGSVPVTVPGNKNPVRLKIGQSVDVASGAIRESYEAPPKPFVASEAAARKDKAESTKDKAEPRKEKTDSTPEKR